MKGTKRARIESQTEWDDTSDQHACETSDESKETEKKVGLRDNGSGLLCHPRGRGEGFRGSLKHFHISHNTRTRRARWEVPQRPAGFRPPVGEFCAEETNEQTHL